MLLQRTVISRTSDGVTCACTYAVITPHSDRSDTHQIERWVSEGGTNLRTASAELRAWAHGFVCGTRENMRYDCMYAILHLVGSD